MLSLVLLTLISHALVIPAVANGQPQRVSYPSSDLMDVARSASALWAGETYKSSRDYFDVVDNEVDRVPGFKTVLYYQNDRPILAISILLSTGQVIDRNRCLIFASSEIKAFGESVRRVTGSLGQKQFPVMS